MIQLTNDIIEQGKSSRGGWSSNQWWLLGVHGRKIKGWKKRIIGREYADSVIKEFLELKDKHLKTRLNKNKDGYVIIDKPITWEDQYKHPNWQRRRLEILKRDKFKCRLCLDTDSLLHVHHLKYDKSKFIWQIHEIYLVTLCHKCHEKEHGRKF